MKKLLPAILVFLCCVSLHGQEIKWAVNTPTSFFSSHLAVDPASNVYLYGSAMIYYRPDLEGSVLRKYSSNGELIFSKEWKTRFFINSMINDGAGHFYFCGSFFGDISEQGIKLHSQGNSDAFIGRMDEQGNIEWTIGFGGAKNDRINDLTFNADSTAIVITGGVDSTIMLYGYEISMPPKSIFVASLDLDGSVTNYRTYAFTPNEYGTNVGLEISGDGKGGYYLLADRMGDHWSNEAHPSGSPMEGRYVFDLNKDLDIRWSRLIINSGCYYGYSCAGMGIQEGKVCVPSFCSGKYGGSGKLEKLDDIAGLTTFSIMNTDGEYYDTYASGKNLFYVGNEEANGCPCENNNPGFARVKVLDENNQDRVLLSKYGFRFANIAQAPNGNIYVYGETSNSDPHLQGHILSQGNFLFAMQNPPTSFSVGDQADNALAAYPNPASDYIEIVDNELMTELIVINSAGVTISEAQPNAKSYTLKNLLPGYYVVRIKNANGYRTAKVLVL
jgi:hypothetical protein